MRGLSDDREGSGYRGEGRMVVQERVEGAGYGNDPGAAGGILHDQKGGGIISYIYLIRIKALRDRRSGHYAARRLRRCNSGGRLPFHNQGPRRIPELGDGFPM